MAKDKTCVALLDKKDLEALMQSYADRFCRVVEDYGTDYVFEPEARELVKKLGSFIRKYEELITEESEPEAV